MMRKFISLLSAAAMTAALIPSVAMAEDTVLYSDSFNGYPTSEKTAEGTVFAAQTGSDYTSVEGNPDWQWIFNTPSSRTLDKITVGFDGDRGDDTASIMINEKEATDKYLSMPQNRFQSRCKPQVTGLDQYTANTGESLVISFNAKVTEGEKGIATLDLGAVGTITSEKLGTDEWKAVKLVVKDGATTIYVDGTQAGDPVSAVPSIIRPVPFDADTKADTGVYATVCIDDLVILSSADGVNATIPTAEDHSFEVEPEATAVPEAAEITDTIKVDFDTTDFDAAGITVTKHKDYTTVEAAPVDGLGDNTSNVYKIAQTSGKTNSYGFATIDFSNITSGKSHIVIDYDLYVTVDGSNETRMKTIFADGALTEGDSNNLSSLFTQGITKSPNAIVNCTPNAWVHTNVDVDLVSGTGTYTVAGAEENVIGTGKITTDLKALTTMSIVSWLTNTSYIDNLTIATGGDIEVEPGTGVTPEPASAVEGSFESKAFVPADATWSNDFATVEGAESVVLNHSKANALAAGDVNVYEDNVNYRGKSIYALYDVLVNKGDKVTLELYNKTALGTTFTLTGNEDGTATAAALIDKGDSVTVGNVVCGTWYRVLIEIPQNNNDGATNTGAATYTIYRIDKADPTKVSEVAVSKAGLTPRNLASKALTTLKFSTEGAPYIDNGAAFVTAGGLSLVEEAPATEAPATPEPASEVEGSFGSKELAPSNDWSTDFAAVEGTGSKVLNHSDANPIVAGDVNVYDDKVNYRGKSIYALYDVLVNKGDKVTLELYNKTDLGTTFVLTGNENGSATASALVDKGDSVTVGKVACGTWYRVIIEIPQNNNNGATNTGAATYTIYRINKADPTKVVGVAAAKAGLTPRNLASKALTTLRFSTEGAPSIDNGVAFVKAGGYKPEIWTKYTAIKENGVLKSVAMTAVDNPANETADPANGVYLWNQFQTPYKAAE